MRKVAFLILFLGGLVISCQNDQINKIFPEKEITQISTIEKEEITIDTTEKEGVVIIETDQRSLCTKKARVASSEKALFAEKADLSAYLPELEEFVINPNETERITTINGTELIIPKGSFDTDLPVKISMRVYEDQKDAYVQQLTTMTTNGGLLESAGMFHIEASTDQGIIDLAPNSELILKMPDFVDGEMEMYYGVADERDDIYWVLDENSKEMAPIAVLTAGRFSKIARTYFIDELHLPKNDMIQLLGKEWTVSLTLDREGNMIGWDNILGDSLKARASQYFVNFMKNHNFYKRKENCQLSPTFTFQSMTRGALDTLESQEAYDEIMLDVWNEFDKSTSDKRKFFTLGGLGFLNIDKKIQLPDIKERTHVLVKREGNANLNLMFVDKNTVVTPSAYTEDYIVFKDVPLKTRLRLIGSCVKGTQMYYGMKEHSVIRGENKLELEFKACTKDEFSSKITGFLAKG
ncbi:MAG: hypothetical protein KC469_01550 [Flavobacteriaceae bacterium]|nr:hypothetical protein [Flavobacteriaceae bacterium]